MPKKHWSNLAGGVEQASASLASDAMDSQGIILEELFEHFTPESIVDVGCGPGYWIQKCCEKGVPVTKAFDFVDMPAERIFPVQHFTQMDLSKPIKGKRRYDLAISTEVAEHIPASNAQVFIDNLCRFSDVVLFSAAVPYQQGIGHVNEHWMEYWARLFNTNGYKCIDMFRLKYWNDLRIHYYYRQNVVLFVKSENLPKFNEMGLEHTDSPISMIHPELLIQAVNRALPNVERRMSQDVHLYYNTLKALGSHAPAEVDHCYGKEKLWWDDRVGS